MINDYIKKIVLLLLLVLTIYITYISIPFILIIVNFINYLITPFLIAFTIAFILQPLVVIIQKPLKKRGLAVMVVVFSFIIVLSLSVYSVLPYLMKEVRVLAERMPEILLELETICNSFAAKFDFLPDAYQPTFNNIKIFIGNYFEKFSSLPGKVIERIISYISYLVLVPIILIYFLLDYEKILCSLRDYLINNNRLRFKNYLGELNQTISSFVRGTFLVMVIMAIVFSIVFIIIGLDFAIFFAIVIAITNVIPYLGPYLGGVLPVLYALISSPARAITIIIIIFIIQELENNLLSPYIHSRRIKTHPLIVILFLLLFGYLFGIVGMIIAVPVLAIVKITIKYYLPNMRKIKP